ncbi:MAG: site-specific integrase [Acidobacteria bacterium Pan2503]|uniref:Site-specific integrase n=1 Tax=Candidatus Acidiferrum panamense TaxID=2741543 RepID=A0A7V8NSK7_9BACT|nr:site-specific integrase [Candidatus Acidoferrum panamensis]
MGRRATVVPRKRGQRYEFRIFWQGKPHRPSLRISEESARKLADRLQTKLDLGTLDLEFLSITFPRYFTPAAPTLGGEEATENTIGHRIAAYVKAAWEKLKPSNRKPFASHARYWIAELGADTPREQLPGKLARMEVAGRSRKTRDTKRAFLRGVLLLAKWDILVPSEPNEEVFKTRRGSQKVEIDPFSEAERDSILGWFCAGSSPERQEWGDYLTVAFYSGIRPGEQYALRWDRDVDWNRGELKIQWAVSGEIEIHETKTNCGRRVWIHPEAMAALKRQRVRTLHAAHGHIWQLPGEGTPVVNQKALWNIWQKALKAVEVKVRKPYSTRHTYATLLLMAGANPDWVARQMGHSVITLRKHYATWIDGPRDKGEIAKVLAFSSTGADKSTNRSTK